MSHPSHCSNCTTELSGAFCSSCGQKALSPRRSIFQLARMAVTEWMGLDGKLVQSLRVLFTRPGALTQLYLAGQRARFLNPLRLYMLASLAFFFFFSFPAPDASNWDIYVEGKQIGKAVERAPGTRAFSLDLPGEESFFGRSLGDRRAEIMELEPQELLERLFDRVEETLPIAFIFFIPLLALAIKILHPRRLLFDHVIFAVHYQSFLFIVLIASRFFGGLLLFLALIGLAGPLYMVFAQRRTYGRSWTATLLTTAALSIVYFLLLGLVLGSQMFWVFLHI